MFGEDLNILKGKVIKEVRWDKGYGMSGIIFEDGTQIIIVTNNKQEIDYIYDE